MSETTTQSDLEMANRHLAMQPLNFQLWAKAMMTSESTSPQKSSMMTDRDNVYNLSGLDNRRRIAKNITASSLLHRVPTRMYSSLPPPTAASSVDEKGASGACSRTCLSHDSSSSGSNDPAPNDATVSIIDDPLVIDCDSRWGFCSKVAANVVQDLVSSYEGDGTAAGDICERKYGTLCVLSGNSVEVTSSSKPTGILLPDGRPSCSTTKPFRCQAKAYEDKTTIGCQSARFGASQMSKNTVSFSVTTAGGCSTDFPEPTQPQLRIVRPLAVNSPFELPRADNYLENPAANAKIFLLKTAGALSSSNVSIINIVASRDRCLSFPLQRS